MQKRIPVKFYGGDDQRVNATISETVRMMQKAGIPYNYEIYEGAGHAFMRSGGDPGGEKANVGARNRAWQRPLNCSMIYRVFYQLAVPERIRNRSLSFIDEDFTGNSSTVDLRCC
ncbi:dienelactone hydrolase family protein [Halalkalibaculum sp. DA384]|uniref:dienelactone hydrolase family protein n=1 Tax=Halalkalibaculum sp. DA384 TaxID=3373606 RepID=UPI003754523E